MRAKKALTVKASKLKKKAVVLSAKKAFTVKKAKGKVTYKLVKITCKKALAKQAKKKIKVSRAGRITCKKGLKRGLYKLKMHVKAAGTKTYKPATKTVTVRIRVK